MRSVWEFAFLALVVFALATEAARCKGKACGKSPPTKKPKQLARTCLDHLKAKKTRCGIYPVYDAKGNSYPVYCDMESEPGNAWTLVWSFSFQEQLRFKRKPFSTNFSVNENSPNWNLYRLTFNRMKDLKAESTHWRSTCSFPKAGVDYKDYVRGTFKDLDVMSFKGDKVCKKVEYINVRGHVGIHKTVPWWQRATYALHTSTSKKCMFNVDTGSVHSEDNFGYYVHTNKKFRCTENNKATTQWWFGGHI